MFQPALQHPPYQVEPCDSDGYGVDIEIAREVDGSRIVLVHCELVPTSIDTVDYEEFSFSIVVYCPYGDHEPFETQNSPTAAPYIPVEMRKKVLELVGSALSTLIGHVKPARVYRVTKDRYPSDKMLIKHDYLTWVLDKCGYVMAEEGTDPLGRRFWAMERNPN